MNYKNRVSFAIGTGRCGTLFLHQLLNCEPEVASSHERNPDNETFHRYCQWHGLPVDHEGFLATKAEEIDADLATHRVSFEATPYLALSVKELNKRFDARFILLVRQPDSVVTSFAHKGFYSTPYRVADVSLATGYQDPGTGRMHNFFARIAPRGAAFTAWNKLTQVGKVAWFWRAWNERAIDEFGQLPDDCYRVVRIEDFDYEKYAELGHFMGFEPQVGQAQFDSLRASKPHAFLRKRNIDDWTEQEIVEFEQAVGPLAERLGYPYRIADLLSSPSRRPVTLGGPDVNKRAEGPRFWRLRRAAAKLLHNLAEGLDAK